MDEETPHPMGLGMRSRHIPRDPLIRFVGVPALPRSAEIRMPGPPKGGAFGVLQTATGCHHLRGRNNDHGTIEWEGKRGFLGHPAVVSFGAAPALLFDQRTELSKL